VGLVRFRTYIFVVFRFKQIYFNQFASGGLLETIATLKQIEEVSADRPEELQTGFNAYDICSGKGRICRFIKYN